MYSSFYSPTGRAAWMYSAYEMAHASVQPFRAWASSVDRSMRDPRSPISGLPGAPFFRAGWRVFDELTRRYGKPEFGIESIETDGINHHVEVEIVKRRTFCNLLRFAKTPQAATAQPKAQPKVLLIAPMSGHFATLLRATVKAMLPTNDVYITDWADARAVPLLQGQFDLHDYIEYLQSFFKELGPDLHVIAVCQPSVPALAATALLAQEDSPYQPKSLTLMAGPVDVANNPTQVNDYAQAHNIAWFKRNVITYVPAPHPGAFRPVYPGFFQLAGFMGMNMDAHVQAYANYFENLAVGADESADEHRRFYDEYLAVMDLTSEYFLQTVETVFQRRELATGTLVHRGRKVDCGAIRKTVLMTVEGERDDICGIGQTEAAHALCYSLSDGQRHHHLQKGVGHYGVFSGRRWRQQIQPRIPKMIDELEGRD